MTAESIDRVQNLFKALVPLIQELNVCIIDGGTDAGVMQMIGKARAAASATFPLIGVAPASKVAVPDTAFLTADRKSVEPNHTHIFLTPGSHWGDESPWLSKIATTLAASTPSLTLLINGGNVALTEVAESVEAHRPVIVIAGSGRLADEIAAAIRFPELPSRGAIAQLIKSGQFILFDLSNPLTELTRLIREMLTPTQPKPAAINSPAENTAANITLLSNAWKRQQTYSKNATAAQRRFINLRICLVGLTVLATILAVLVKQSPGISQTTTNPLNLCLIIVPILISILLAGSVKFGKGNSWILLRGSAEALKREIFLYRTRVGSYRVNRDALLAYQIKLISERLKGSPVHHTCLNPYETETSVPLPPTPLKEGKEDRPERFAERFADLNAETYLAMRLDDQFDRYRRKAKELDSQLQLLQWAVYIIGGMGTLLAAVQLGSWVAVTSALTTAFASFLEFRRIEDTLVGYNLAADNLYDLKVLWNSLSEQDKQKPENVALLVETTEKAIQSENQSWLQNMQDSLLDFYKQVETKKE